jgi:hypothetical protein
LVKPSPIKVKTFIKELIINIKKHKNWSAYDLVLKLNQKLRGWAEHYKKVSSKKVFGTIQYHVWKTIWTMIRKRHIRHSTTWLNQTYFEKVGANNSIFVGKNKEEKLTLFLI